MIFETRIPVKPISVNELYLTDQKTGKRFRNPKYDSFLWEMAAELPPVKVPNMPLAVRYEFGVSNPGMDLDNCVKATQDAMATKYDFNDKMIFAFYAKKEVVDKGDEYIDVKMKEFQK